VVPASDIHHLRSEQVLTEQPVEARNGESAHLLGHHAMVVDPHEGRQKRVVVDLARLAVRARGVRRVLVHHLGSAEPAIGPRWLAHKAMATVAQPRGPHGSLKSRVVRLEDWRVEPADVGGQGHAVELEMALRRGGDAPCGDRLVGRSVDDRFGDLDLAAPAADYASRMRSSFSLLLSKSVMTMCSMASVIESTRRRIKHSMAGTLGGSDPEYDGGTLTSVRGVAYSCCDAGVVLSV